MKKSFKHHYFRFRNQGESATPIDGTSDRAGDARLNIVSSKEIIARPMFLFSSDKVEHDVHSPLPTCCKAERRDFHAYYIHHSNEENPTGSTPSPTGIVCNNCHGEWLSETESTYMGVKFNDDDKLDVMVIDSIDTEIDGASSIVDINAKRYFTFKRKKPNSIGLQILSMANSTRTLIDIESDEIELLKSGDHVTWHRPYGVWHHQLITKNKGRGKYDIIHFDTKKSSKLSAQIEVQQRDERDFRSELGAPYKINYSDSFETENPVSLVFDRANSKLHNKDYGLLTNNCEHMVTFCKTGCHRSFQVYWLNAKLIFLFFRVVILVSVVIGVSMLQSNINHNNYSNNTNFTPVTNFDGLVIIQCPGKHNEEWSVVLVATFLELLIFVFIVSLHWKLYIKRKICHTDRRRRVGEATAEALFSIIMYFAYILVNSCWSIIIHILVFALFGTLGKCGGFFLGHCMCQKIMRLKNMKRVDTEENNENTGLV